MEWLDFRAIQTDVWLQLSGEFDWKTKKIMLQCNAKAYQSILQNPIAKKQKRIPRTDQNTSQTCYRKTWCRQKWNMFEQLLKIKKQTHTKSTEN